MDRDFGNLEEMKYVHVVQAVPNDEGNEDMLLNYVHIDIEDIEISHTTPYTLWHREKGCNRVLKRPRISSERSDALKKVTRRLFSDSPQVQQLSDFSTDYEEIFEHLQCICKDEVILEINSQLFFNYIRCDAINFMILVNDEIDNPDILQTSRWYFDMAYSKNLINRNNYHIFAAACFWVAHKVYSKVPSSNMWMRLALISSTWFGEKELLDAEKKLMKIVECNLKPLIPHDFVSYLCWSCKGADKDNSLELTARFLCDAGLMVDTTLCGVPVSDISVAGVEFACQLLEKNEAMTKLILMPLYKSTDNYALRRIRSVQRDAVIKIYASDYTLSALKALYTNSLKPVADKVLIAIKKQLPV